MGPQYLQGCFVKPGVSDPPTDKLPMELTRCVSNEGDSCGLVQLRHTVPGELLYDTYWYRSRINDTMREHLRWVSKTAVGVHGGAPERVLDIGCNDGTLLGNFPECDRWGIDPSSAVDDAPDDIELVRDFFPSDELERQDGVFDIVTAIAMFYDVDDPVGFARAAERLLAPGGVLVLEVAYLPSMLATTGYDSICHEHLAYYSLDTLSRVLRQAGLVIVRADLNGINGGSVCCFITRSEEAGDRADGSVQALEIQERELGLDGDTAYDEFADRVRDHRAGLVSLLGDLRRQGSVVHVYGASTKGNTLLQYCEIDGRQIPYAAERNPDKVGARTLGTDIDIISEADSRAAAPDYYLVLPWHFRDEIVAREAQTLASGCRLIFPLPEPEIVGGADPTPKQRRED